MSRFPCPYVKGEVELTNRHWIITAYLARKLAEGEPEWNRS